MARRYRKSVCLSDRKGSLRRENFDACEQSDSDSEMHVCLTRRCTCCPIMGNSTQSGLPHRPGIPAWLDCPDRLAFDLDPRTCQLSREIGWASRSNHGHACTENLSRPAFPASPWTVAGEIWHLATLLTLLRVELGCNLLGAVRVQYHAPRDEPWGRYPATNTTPGCLGKTHV